MKYIVFNDVSFRLSNHHVNQLSTLLDGMARGIAVLTSKNCCHRSIFATTSFADMRSNENVTLYDVVHNARKNAETREGAISFLRLITRSPLFAENNKELRDNFYACECQNFKNAEALLFCGLTGAIAASLCTDNAWDTDSIELNVDRIGECENIFRLQFTVQHLSKESHGEAIAGKIRTSARNDVTQPQDIYKNWNAVFASIVSGKDVEKQLNAIDKSLTSALFDVLVSLDRSAREWENKEVPYPKWYSTISGESKPTMDNPKLRNARYFESAITNKAELFEKHAKVAGIRVHFYLHNDIRKIEVGYIGGHLPTSGEG